MEMGRILVQNRLVKNLGVSMSFDVPLPLTRNILFAAAAAAAGLFLFNPMNMLRHLTGVPIRALSSNAPTGVSVCYVTVPDEKVGTELSEKLVREKLAACVNIVPGVKSVYMWNGKLESDNEMLLTIKTRTALVSKLTAFVKKNHPYELPEVICTDITAGSNEYLRWVMDSTQHDI